MTFFFDDRDQAVPYTATADDVAPTGQQIWQELQSGKWGEIAPFTVTPEMLEAAREARRQEIEAWRTEQEAKPFTFEWNGVNIPLLAPTASSYPTHGLKGCSASGGLMHALRQQNRGTEPNPLLFTALTAPFITPATATGPYPD
ncbi:prophage tail protein [Shigella flexneri]|nr:prophage tail protein [Shigella flexneri]